MHPFPILTFGQLFGRFLILLNFLPEVDVGAVLVPLGHGVALGELDLEGGRLARGHLGVRHLLDELGSQLDDCHFAGALLYGFGNLFNDIAI